jgi:L-amino acid N-acyltransferase YncA
VKPLPIVRPATYGDAAAISRLYTPFVVASPVSFEESPPGADQIASRISSKPRLPWLIAEVDSELCGFAYASLHRQRAAYRWSADCSVYVDPGHQGQGLGRALYGLLIADLTSLGYVSLFAGITLPNPASIGLHESFGFRPVGIYRNVGYKQGRWRDVGWWQKRLAEPSPAPADPLEWRP